MNKVFVSYSRRNNTFAERLARDLDDAGMEVWVDFRQIHGGEMWQEEIYRGIERSDMLVVCLSPDAVSSTWVQREVNTAREQGKMVIPVMAVNAFDDLQQSEALGWLLNVHFILFEGRYEEAFPELLEALPGKRHVSVYDVLDVTNIPNPFKGLEAFQQTDSQFFFGRERLIDKALERLREDRPTRFLAVVGASGSGKSSLVRAGVIPALRRGALPDSEHWRIVIFTPGERPVEALAQRLAPLMIDQDTSKVNDLLHTGVSQFKPLIERSLVDAHPNARLLLVVDQFEEIFTRATAAERDSFLALLEHAVTDPDSRALVLITMRADFFDRLSAYPALAELFEQENMVIVAEMTPTELLRSIEGPAQAVGLVYDDGLSQRILEDVRRQPGSLPLLQYALTELYKRREGNRLTTAAYEDIGGIRRALAGHAEKIYSGLGPMEQSIMRRVLLRLVEVSDTGEATRRKVERSDLVFRDVPDQAVQNLIDMLTSSESRLLIASRQIKASDDLSAPAIWIEISHEALIREWERFNGWVAENMENLRYGTELLQAASDWKQSKRDNAYLVFGNRLMRAQAWLEGSDATPLQREFIQASAEENARLEQRRQEQVERELDLQRKATTRLRMTVGVLIIGLAAAVGLIFLAVNSEQRAQDALAGEQIALSTAVANEQRALSLALSSNANRAQIDEHDELAVLLAVNANQIANPPPQSRRILADVVFAPGTRQRFDQGNTEVIASVLLPEGREVITTSRNTLIIWDVHTGQEQRRFGAINANVDLPGHQGTIRAVVLSPDGTAVAAGDSRGEVFVWRIQDGALIQAFTGATSAVRSLAFSPDGSHLLGGTAGGQLILWRTEDGAILRAIDGHAQSVNSVAFRPDGQRFMSGSDDRTARIWNLNGALVGTLEGHTGGITVVAFSPTANERAMTASMDRTVKHWNLTQDANSLLRTYEGHDGGVTAAAFSPDGQTFVSGSSDRRIIHWNVLNGQILGRFSEHERTVNDLVFSPDGSMVLSSSGDGSARLWDIQRTDEVRRFQGHGVNVNQRTVVGVYGPDAHTVLSASYDRTLRLWDRYSGLTIQQFRGHTDVINDVTLNADGTRALSVSSDATAILWDVSTGESLRILRDEVRNEVMLVVRFIPGINRALTGAADGSIVLWDLETGEIIQRYGPKISKGDPGHDRAIRSLDVHPNGTRFVSGADDNLLLLWDLETGTIIREYKGHPDSVSAAAFNPRGTWVISGSNDGTLILWDVVDDSTAPGGVLRRFNGHDSAVLSAAFSPDGQTIASGARDRTLRVWDIASGFEVRRYTAPMASFRSVLFSPDGQHLLTGMTDATLREWRVLSGAGDLVGWAFANRYVMSPTCEQRDQFSLMPLCEDGVLPPASTPVPQPSPSPSPDVPVLAPGTMARVNTTDGDALNVRVSAKRDAEIVATFERGTIVALLEGPVMAEGFRWWKIQAQDGTEGWSVELVPEIWLQTLIPLR